MKKKILLCVAIVVVVVLSYFYAHIDKNAYLYDRNADTSTFIGTGVLLEGEEVRQTFVADENTIDGINIKVAMTGNVDEIVLHYAVLDENLNELFKGSVSGDKLENNKFNQLKITTIDATEGNKYTLVLSEEKSDNQNGIGFYIEPSKQSEQILIVRENETEGTLVTRIVCNRFDVETFVVFLGVVAFIVMFMKVLYKFFK